MVEKKIRLGDSQIILQGLSDDDVYFSSLRDGSDQQFLQLCRAVLEPDGVVFDVGANIGVTSLIASRFVPKGSVVAFEPEAEVSKLLEENIFRNGASVIERRQCALSASPGEGRFEGNSAFGFLASNGQSENSYQEVEISTVDEEFKRLGLSRLDLLKIDVEGFEMQVMQGASRTLHECAPVVFCEFNSWCIIDHTEHNPITVARFLVDSFRYLFLVDRSSTDLRLLSLPVASPRELARHIVHENIVRHNSWDDIVCFNDVRYLEAFRPFIDRVNDAEPKDEQRPARLLRRRWRRAGSPRRSPDLSSS